MSDPTSIQSKCVHPQVFAYTNPAFRHYLIVASLLILKMLAVTCMTIFQRLKNKVYINEEDLKGNPAGKVDIHPDVERTRRAFQNDMENIPLFLLISLCYLWVNPPSGLCIALLYIYLISRTAHTIVYAVYVAPFPSRGICFFMGFLIIVYMCLHVFFYGCVKKC